MRILILDDNEVLQDLVGRFLDGWYTPQGATLVMRVLVVDDDAELLELVEPACTSPYRPRRGRLAPTRSSGCKEALRK